MYVKLGFSIAAHLEPEILVIDEILAVGDAAFQRKCIDKMQELCRSSGRTILFVSHSMATIRRLCRQCLYLEKGRSHGIMPTEEAIARYSASSAPSELALDVSTRSRDWGTDGAEARLHHVAVAADTPPRFGAPLQIECLVHATRTLEDVMLGFAFTTTEGQRIMTLDTDGGGRTFKLQPGPNRLRVRLPSRPLHPGRYHVSASLARGRHFFDTIDSFALWTVETSVNDRESDRSFGGCRLTPDFELLPPA
jgi:lipopolysaccharide transport system ATP-binding protein